MMKYDNLDLMKKLIEVNRKLSDLMKKHISALKIITELNKFYPHIYTEVSSKKDRDILSKGGK